MKAKAIVLFLVAALLQGCSVTRMAYDNADMFLRWQANSYFDFQDEQAEELDRSLDAFLAWHRSRALPQYARLAEEASLRMLRGVKREDLEWGYDAVQGQIQEALGAAAAQSAGLLERLNSEQIAHLERRLAGENRKFVKEQLQGSAEDLQQRRVRRNVERLEEWFGPLTDAQVERVRRYCARAPFGAALRERDRLRRQADLLAMLRAREARQRLAHWAQSWESGREPAHARAAQETRAEYFDMLLDMDRMLSQAQRDKAAARFQRYAVLFDSLSRR